MYKWCSPETASSNVVLKAIRNILQEQGGGRRKSPLMQKSIFLQEMLHLLVVFRH